MLDGQIRPWGVSDVKVLNAVNEVPRELFVPPRYKEVAYADISIPLNEQQNMLEPKTIAKAIQELNIISSDRVLEIGSGTGYATAVLSKLANEVTSLEIDKDLYAIAKNNLNNFGLNNNIKLINVDAFDYEDSKPFDAVFISASMLKLYSNFLTQLKVEGKMFAIVGSNAFQEATRFTKKANNQLHRQVIFDTLADRIVASGSNNNFHF